MEISSNRRKYFTRKKSQMNHKKDKSPIDLEYIQKLISEVEELRAENEKLKDKVGVLSIKNDILKDSLEIVQKKALLKALQPPKKSKYLIGMK